MAGSVRTVERFPDAISVRIIHRGKESRDSPREAFWDDVFFKLQAEGRFELTQISLFENAFCRTFSDDLRRHALRYFDEKDRGDEREASDIASRQLRFAFDTRISGYGSLDLSIDLVGANNAISFFDNNFELFEVFLNSYIPRGCEMAFVDAVQEVHGLPLRPSMEKMDYEIKVNPAIPILLDATPETVAEPRTRTATSRARWAWTLANSSLVVPVLLALAVLLVAVEVLMEERQLVHEERAKLAKLQSMRLDSLNDLQKQLLLTLSNFKSPGPQSSPPVP
ncbi:MAG: hypothetical protein QNJ09_00705 [Paracoccaceae bacterium]|nr:hypothetical protein [Paracoccaceae bacterium]